MTLAVLVAMFQLVSDNDLTRPLDDWILTTIANCPVDQRLYELIAEEAFQSYVLTPDEPDYKQFQRVETIYRALLYHDGRTLSGCIRLVRLSYAHPSFGEFGVNSLAAIANYVRKGRPLPIPATAVLSVADEVATDEDLSHNAAEIARFIRKNYSIEQ